MLPRNLVLPFSAFPFDVMWCSGVKSLWVCDVQWIATLKSSLGNWSCVSVGLRQARNIRHGSAWTALRHTAKKWFRLAFCIMSLPPSKVERLLPCLLNRPRHLWLQCLWCLDQTFLILCHISVCQSDCVVWLAGNRWRNMCLVSWLSRPQESHPVWSPRAHRSQYHSTG